MPKMDRSQVETALIREQIRAAREGNEFFQSIIDENVKAYSERRKALNRQKRAERAAKIAEEVRAEHSVKPRETKTNVIDLKNKRNESGHDEGVVSQAQTRR